MHGSGHHAGQVLDEGQRHRAQVVAGQVADDAAAGHLGVLVADLLGEAWRGGADDACGAFEGAEGGSALSGLVDVTLDHGLTIGGLIGAGLLALGVPEGGTQLAGSAVGVEVLQGGLSGQDAGLVEGVLEGDFGGAHGVGQGDLDLKGHQVGVTI